MAEKKSDHIASILKFFKNLHDPRNTVSRRHLFRNLIVLRTVCRANEHKALTLRLVPYCDEHQLEAATTDAVTLRVCEQGDDHLRSNRENLLERSLYMLRQHER